TRTAGNAQLHTVATGMKIHVAGQGHAAASSDARAGGCIRRVLIEQEPALRAHRIGGVPTRVIVRSQLSTLPVEYVPAKAAGNTQGGWRRAAIAGKRGRRCSVDRAAGASGELDGTGVEVKHSSVGRQLSRCPHGRADGAASGQLQVSVHV